MDFSKNILSFKKGLCSLSLIISFITSTEIHWLVYRLEKTKSFEDFAETLLLTASCSSSFSVLTQYHCHSLVLAKIQIKTFKIILSDVHTKTHFPNSPFVACVLHHLYLMLRLSFVFLMLPLHPPSLSLPPFFPYISAMCEPQQISLGPVHLSGQTQTAISNNTVNMDSQVRREKCSVSVAQTAVVASAYPSFLHWTSTSFQNASAHEAASVSSLVPSTVLTLMPHCEFSAAGRNSRPEAAAPFSEMRSQLPLPGILSSPSGSSGNQDQTCLVLPPAADDNVLEVQPRTPADGGPLEEGSVGLTLAKDSGEIDSGMLC